MDDLHNTISQYSDEQLRVAFYTEKDQYTPEAIEIMHEEVTRRGLTFDRNDDKKDERMVAVRLNSEDFVRFDFSFSRIDLMLASAILRDNAVPFFVDNPASADSIPTELESEKRYTLFIHNTFLEKTHQLLDEHFIKSDKSYLLKYTEVRDRLRAFNFNDIHLTEKDSNEELDVSLSTDEKKTIVLLGNRLLKEAEQVEEKQERVLFYYDAIEPLIERLKEPERSLLSRNDLLTILEILQVYIDDPAVPPSMEEATSQLLAFFLQT
jgi:hypothetical protein